MINVIDQTGRGISLPHTPQRIISLVPSQTEFLADIGLQDEVIGITKFCVRPDSWFRNKTRVGGTKQLKPDIIRQLQPDLVLANKEENVKEQIMALAADYPVWVSDVNDLPSACEMMLQIGLITGKEEAAIDLVDKIKKNFLQLERFEHTIPAAYLIWKDPYMTAGGDTFIHAMMENAGLSNIFSAEKRYPVITIEQLSSCKLLLLSSEPFPFKQKHIEELQKELPETKIVLVDGEMFSWYGSRLQYAPDYFSNLRSILITS